MYQQTFLIKSLEALCEDISVWQDGHPRGFDSASVIGVPWHAFAVIALTGPKQTAQLRSIQVGEETSIKPPPTLKFL